jgi:hypothetical protein
MQRALASGLVISGGGALLPGICDVAERVLDCPARIGLAQGFLDWPDELNDPARGPRRRVSPCMRRACAARWIWNGSRWECLGRILR